MIYILYFLTILFLIIGIQITKNKVNPLTIFNLIWLVVLFLYQFRLSYLQLELDNKTMLLLIIAVILYSISFILTYKIRYSRRNDFNKNVNKELSYKFIKINFYIWLFIELLEVFYSRGLPVIWTLTGSAKTYFDFGIPTVHGFANAYGLVIITLFYYYYLSFYKKFKIKKNSCLIYISIMLLYYLALITRQVIISAIIQMFILKIFFVKKLNLKRMLILCMIGIIAFGLVGNLRTGYDGFNRVALMKSEVNPFLIGISWVYMYLTMSVANINNVVLLGINNYGIYPIAETYIPTVISKIMFGSSNVIIPKYLVSEAFTVSGYFIHFYLGYGAVGVAIISIIYGIMGGIFLKKVKKSINEKNIVYYSICMQIILLSFFYNHLLYLPSGFQYVIVYLLFKIRLQNNEEYVISET